MFCCRYTLVTPSANAVKPVFTVYNKTKEIAPSFLPHSSYTKQRCWSTGGNKYCAYTLLVTATLGLSMLGHKENSVNLPFESQGYNCLRPLILQLMKINTAVNLHYFVVIYKVISQGAWEFISAKQQSQNNTQVIKLIIKGPKMKILVFSST